VFVVFAVGKKVAPARILVILGWIAFAFPAMAETRAGTDAVINGNGKDPIVNQNSSGTVETHDSTARSALPECDLTKYSLDTTFVISRSKDGKLFLNVRDDPNNLCYLVNVRFIDGQVSLNDLANVAKDNRTAYGTSDHATHEVTNTGSDLSGPTHYTSESNQTEQTAKPGSGRLLFGLLVLALAVSGCLAYVLRSEVMNLMGFVARVMGGLWADLLSQIRADELTSRLWSRTHPEDPSEHVSVEEFSDSYRELSDVKAELVRVGRERAELQASVNSMQLSVGSLRAAYRRSLGQFETSHLVRDLLVMDAMIGARDAFPGIRPLADQLRLIDEHLSSPPYSAGATVPLMIDFGLALFRYLNGAGCAPSQCTEFAQEIADTMNERTAGAFKVFVPRPGNLVEPTQMSARGNGRSVRRVLNWAIFFEGVLQQKAMVDTF
jgi:hypothetical protein